MKGGYPQHRGFQRVYHLRRDGLERANNPGCGRDRVNCQVRQRRVPALAGNGQFEHAAARHQFARPDHKAAAGQSVPDVHAQGVIWFPALKQTVSQHRDCALPDFFGWLENQQNRSVNFIAAACQQTRRVNSDGGVRVMPAGVHYPWVSGGVFCSGCLLDRQGVHIEPKHNQRVGFGSV